MRVYYVNQYANTPDNPGGTRHFELAQAAKKFGIGVDIFAADLQIKTRQYHRRKTPRDTRTIAESFDGIPFYWVYTRAYRTNDWRRALSMLQFSWNVYRILCRQPRPDIIIGSSPHLFAALAAERAAAHHHVPFVLEVRDIWPQTMIDMVGERTSTRFLGYVANHLYHRARRIITLAKGTEEFLAQEGIATEKFTYIPNGVPTQKFPELTPFDRLSIRVKYDLPTDKVLCVYAGAHALANGLDTVIEAAVRLQSDKRVGFVLVGDGPMKGRLVEQASNYKLTNITFLAPIPRTEIPYVLGSMDIGLLILQNVDVFRYGISPNKLFDYWAARLPVIATTPGEIGDLITTAKAGKVVEPGQPDKLCAAILDLLADGVARSESGLRGRQFVTQEFEHTLLGKRLVAMLQNMNAPTCEVRDAAHHHG